MTKFKRFDVVVVPFPFADLATSKQRPALAIKIVKSQRFDSLIICAMITSQVDGENLDGDFFLDEWRDCGLLHPSKLRLAKLVTLEAGMIRKKLGTLSKKSQKQVQEKLNAFLKT